MSQTNFHIDLDGNGYGCFHFSKVTVFSIKIKADAVINTPANADFDTTLIVNGNQIGSWHLQTGQHVQCQFKTGSKLNLDIEVRSTARNTRLEGSLTY